MRRPPLYANWVVHEVRFLLTVAMVQPIRRPPRAPSSCPGLGNDPDVRGGKWLWSVKEGHAVQFLVSVPFFLLLRKRSGSLSRSLRSPRWLQIRRPTTPRSARFCSQFMRHRRSRRWTPSRVTCVAANSVRINRMRAVGISWPPRLHAARLAPYTKSAAFFDCAR